MKLSLLCVGKPGRLLAPAIEEYERRAARYWNLEIVEIKETRAARGTSDERVRAEESERLLERLPAGVEAIALTRTGTDAFSSDQFARYLQELAVRARAGAAFVIGGARGLGPALLERADRQLRLSACTLPHDIARLVLTEQLYRAGTILRGEPYHKGED